MYEVENTYPKLIFGHKKATTSRNHLIYMVPVSPNQGDPGAY